MKKELFDRKQPCKNCPYRKDAPLAYWSIEEFKQLMDKEAEMMGTVYMCHKKDGCACVGWLIDQERRGVPSIALRLAMMKRRANYSMLEALKSPAPLFDNIREMCIANFPELENYIPKEK